MTKSLIKVENLLVRYGDRVILNKLNFSVASGEVLVVLGGSGCGKSTLLNHMIGLFEPERGHIWINGDDIVNSWGKKRLKILNQFGVMFQGGALFGSMSLLENVRLPLEEKTDLPSEIIDAIARNKLSLVGLSGFADYMPAEISGGMQKRAAIARAMVLDPDILFLDEPSAGLDPITSSSLDQLILRLSRDFGITFVIVSHELASIFTIADRVIMLQDGNIIADGNPNAMRDNSDIAYVRQFFNREVIAEVDNGA